LIIGHFSLSISDYWFLTIAYILLAIWVRAGFCGDLGPGYWDLGTGTWVLGPGAWDLGSGSRTLKPRNVVGSPGRQAGVHVAGHRQGATRQAGRMWPRSRWQRRTTMGGPEASGPPYPIHAPDHIRPAWRVAPTHDGAERTPGYTRGYPCSTRVPRVAGRILVEHEGPGAPGAKNDP